MTTNALPAAAMLSDTELLAQVNALAANEREATARLIAFLAEVDARRLYLGEGCSSLFTYCTQVLYLSEHAAYGRIEAARAARKFPVVLELLASGSLHLTAVCLLAPHLTLENHLAVLAAARHKSKREVEQQVAALRPQPPVPSVVRKLPIVKPVALPVDAAPPLGVDPLSMRRAAIAAVPVSEPPKRVAETKPLALEQYKVQFTVSRETYDKLRLAQDLLRHTIPNGDVAAIFDRALTLLVTELQKTKHAATLRPRATRSSASQGRHIPAAVKREVWARDGGQCAFVGLAGRCTERGLLEYHHLVPFADGGSATVANVTLRCRAHNGYEAERWFGLREDDLLREGAPAFEFGLSAG